MWLAGSLLLLLSTNYFVKSDDNYLAMTYEQALRLVNRTDVWTQENYRNTAQKVKTYLSAWSFVDLYKNDPKWPHSRKKICPLRCNLEKIQRKGIFVCSWCS